MARTRIKIALVNPRIESYSSTMPPLGLLYIAAVLEKNDFSVRIFDIYPYDDSDIEALLEYHPNVVGMSILTDYWNRAKHISEAINHDLPDSTFIIGGVHVTALPEESLTELNADIGVIGEGEITMLELCNAIADNTDKAHVKGIIYKENDTFIKTPARPYIENLDEIPHPARQMLNFESYLVPPGIIRGHWSERSTTIMTSRGCPFQCIWCGSQCTFGRKVRYRSVDNVIEEIEFLISEHKINTIWIVDDTFTLSKNRVNEFCDKILARNIKIVWGCQAHIKTADLEMFKQMKRAGCIQLDFGVESGSNKVLQQLKKDSSSELIERAFQIARSAGLRTAATFMFGSPEEEEEDVELTFTVAKKIQPDFVSSFFITPYPGTELMEMVERNKWAVPRNRQEIGLKKKPALQIYFNEEQLFDIRKRFQKEFAFRNFAGLILSPVFFYKAAMLALRYPGGLLAGAKKFLRTKVVDDFFFEFLIYYTKQKLIAKKCAQAN